VSQGFIGIIKLKDLAWTRTARKQQTRENTALTRGLCGDPCQRTQVSLQGLSF